MFHRRRWLPALVAIWIGAGSVGVSTDDWPQWRGLAGVGVTAETGLPLMWSDTEHVAWRVKLPGMGVSTPVVAGGRVFATGQTGSGSRREGNHPSFVQGEAASGSGERMLGGRARDTSIGTPSPAVAFVVSAHQWSDGRQIWQHALAADGPLPAVHDKHNLATPSPVTDGETVVALFATGQAVALDASTGTVRWTRHLGRDYAPFEINWGHASSPVLHGDLVIFLCYHEPASYLLALDKRTGRLRWKRDRQPGAVSYSTPLVVSSGGRSMLVVNSTQGIEAYDATTGDPMWLVKEEHRFAVPTPVHHDGVIYTTRGYRSSPALAIRLGGTGDVSASHVLWRAPTGGPYVSSFVYYDGLLYMATELGIVTAVDPATGTAVWRDRIGGIFSASPVAGDGKIYLVSETGQTVVLGAGRVPRVLARNTVSARLTASPAISNGRLILRGDDELIAIGPR
jgi:outer membrane protein assembly factor BamB